MESTTTKGFCEFNIRIGSLGQRNWQDPEAMVPALDDIPLKLLEDPVTMQQAKECAFSAICDGYTTIVFNFERAGTS